MELPWIDPDRCDGCGQCAEVCCADAIRVDEGIVSITDDCIICLACAQLCPAGAIAAPELPGRPARSVAAPRPMVGPPWPHWRAATGPPRRG